MSPADDASTARTRRTEAPEVRRRQLLDAAKRRFTEVGFHATKMAEVAAEAGVSVGLIYQHFPSKEALIEGIIHEDMERQLESIERIFNEPRDSFVELIMRGLTEYFAIAANQDRTALMLEIAAESVRNPRIREFAVANEAKIRAVLRERLAQVKPDAWTVDQAEGRFLVLSAMMQGVAIQQSIKSAPPEPAILEALAEAAGRLFMPEAKGGEADREKIRTATRKAGSGGGSAGRG